MNIRSLEVFRAIMHSGSTTTAGRALDLSQSAISRQLTGLEDELGLLLFHRDKGRLIPTAEAVSLLPQIADIVDRFAEMRRRAEDLKAGKAGDLLIKAAFPHSIATTLLPDVIARFNAARPFVAVEILSGPYGAVERMVADREADLGFVRLPAEEADLHVLPIIRSRMVCALPSGHRLAGEGPIELCDLAGTDLVLIGRSRGPGRELDQRLRKMRPPARCVIEAHSVETACALVAAGLGISIVPAHIGNLFAGHGVELRPFAGSGWNDYGIVSRLAPLSAGASLLVALLREAFSGMTFETEML
jgi:DNA-binding transcriptional LysR family regulator